MSNHNEHTHDAIVHKFASLYKLYVNLSHQNPHHKANLIIRSNFKPIKLNRE